MLRKVRGYGGDEQGGGADPVEDEVGVHADLGGDLAVPVPCALEFIEAVFEGVFVVCAENGFMYVSVWRSKRLVELTPRSGLE